ncbi:hypothetical protein V1264_016499 [Littorina saxatilis]|uniref:G-protein coupled receptors family 1 profile domain-containing protein n=1 Tax=Littorina saxatilis TaxID=31220 RepID=A0AAN9BSG8_9CAEN
MQWQDSTVAYYLDFMPDGSYPQCGVLTVKDRSRGKKVGHVRMWSCLRVKALYTWSYTLCQKPMAESGQTMTTTVRPPLPQFTEVALTTLQNRTDSDSFVVCPRGHLVHSFLACDPSSACFAADDIGFSSRRESWALPSYSSCDVNMTSLPPSFTCANGADHVPYTFVCDHRQDCLDNSDEDFCVYPPCNVTWQFQCRSHQCVPVTGKCDGNADCHDKTDEDRCGTGATETRPKIAMRPPALVTIDGSGSYMVRILFSTVTSCPETYFKCPSIGYCIPVFLRCNGVNDCPEKEDEEDCGAKSSECPGYYRCRGVLDTCLHLDHVCDGWPQCPQLDDEMFCNSTCPAECVCLGRSFVCRQSFEAHSYPEVRFLDADASGMKPAALTANVLLIHLSLANCDLTDFGNVTLKNLRSLDLNGNRIRAVSDVHLVGLSKLETLFLSANPLTSLFASQPKHGLSASKLTRLDFSNVEIHSFDPRVLSQFPNLQTLNLSGCGINSVTNPARFNLVSKLRVLDVRGCPLYLFSAGMLKPLNRLRTVRSDNYKLCCRANLPDRFLSNRECEAPQDKIASCEDLFKSNVHRLSWYTSTSMSLVGNIAALATRIILNRTSRQSREGRSGQQSVNLFVSSLFVCGCVHAVYMAVISIADAVFQGSYVLKDTTWRGSALCTSAGLLWLLSSELSLLLVCLITIDRVLVLWCPYTSWQFSDKSAKVAVVITWVGSTAAALLPLSSDLKWFQQTPLCSPLLLSVEESRGEAFVFGMFSVFNVALSWVVVLGQMLIYVHLRRHALAFVHAPGKTKELSTSRRVMMLVVCDVILWLVIGHGSHLAASGMYMSDDVVAAAQVMVMPLNWTLKPLLHVLGTLLERRRTDREERMLKILMAKSQL